MWNKPFATIFKKPLIFLGFSANVLVTVALNVYLYAFSSIMSSENAIIIIIILSIIVYLLISFLVKPPILHYAYEVCADKKEKRWYKKGLKRNWWKIAVWTMISLPAYLIVALIASLLLKIPAIGFLISAFIMLCVASFYIIGSAAVIVEDDFKTALGTTFSIGDRFVAKLIGTYVLFVLPYGILELISYLLKGADTIILPTITTIYLVFFQTFLYVFTMYQYLEEKNKKIEEESKEQPEKEEKENYDFY